MAINQLFSKPGSCFSWEVRTSLSRVVRMWYRDDSWSRNTLPYEQGYTCSLCPAKQKSRDIVLLDECFKK